MELKSYDDILKLQQQFADQINKQMLALRKTNKATGDAIIAGTRASLKEAQSAVASLEQAKTETLQRLDARIALQKEAVERLTGELEVLEKAQTPPAGATPAVDPRVVATPVADTVTRTSKTTATKKKAKK
jgi:hypothetical protein